MSRSDIHSGDVLKSSITEPVYINGNKVLVNFSIETVVSKDEENTAAARVARAAVRGLIEVQTELLDTKSGTNSKEITK